MVSVAVLYERDGYDTSGPRLLGRHAAGEGFLKALARYGTAPNLYCYTGQEAGFQDFCQRVQPWLSAPKPCHWVPTETPEALGRPGVLYRPDPLIVSQAWQRRWGDPRAYSLCGVTHTLVSKETMTGLGDLLTAPVQPWDAIICTSQTVRTMLSRMLGEWAEYLAQRTGGRPALPVQLPVIPLGVDPEQFVQGEAATTARHRWRNQLGIPAEAVVVLFVGRLIFHAKAHPVPMYLALEIAARRLGQRLYLIQAGWFEDEAQAEAFKSAPADFCPSVTSLFVDGRRAEVRREIWAAADIFMSLADNIQETFGLTPLEAMATGLPVIVSDWDGYRESVRHGVDGFRVPTLMAPPGSGQDWAARYLRDTLNYPTYIGHVSMGTAVDLEACVAAVVALAQNPQLRHQLGTNGRQRIAETYDWRVVIPAYEALWGELAERRQQAEVIAPVVPGQPAVPLLDDPFHLLDYYASEGLHPGLVVRLGPLANPGAWAKLKQTGMTQFGARERLPESSIQSLVNLVGRAGSITVAELAAQLPQDAAGRLGRTLVYLVKFGVLSATHAPIPEAASLGEGQ